MTLEDVLILARTVYGEARGESFVGKKAVVHVIINRTNARIGDRDHSYLATAVRHMQFSTWNENDPNRARIDRVGFEDSTFRECVRAVLAAFDEEDFTKGSRHYHTVSIMPTWAIGHVPVYKTGEHVFYNDVR